MRIIWHNFFESDWSQKKTKWKRCCFAIRITTIHCSHVWIYIAFFQYNSFKQAVKSSLNNLVSTVKQINRTHISRFQLVSSKNDWYLHWNRLKFNENVLFRCSQTFKTCMICSFIHQYHKNSILWIKKNMKQHEETTTRKRQGSCTACGFRCRDFLVQIILIILLSLIL